MHILALVPGGIGNQILFFPTLETLKHHYPEASVDVITEPSTVGIYRICPLVRRSVPFDFNDRNSLADWSNLLGVIREQEYEVVLTVKTGWEVGLLLWLSGIPARIGYDNTGTLFLTNSVPDLPEAYWADRYHQLLKGLGIDQPCPPLNLRVPRRDLDWAEGEQRRLGLGTEGYILIYPQDGPGRYPAQNWQIIVQKLRERQPHLPVLVVQTITGLETIAALNQSGLTCSGVSPEQIGQLVALIAGANVVICPEGDVLQMAVAVQTLTVGLFGTGKPQQVLPESDKFLSLVSSTGKLEDITPQQVLEAILGT